MLKRTFPRLYWRIGAVARMTGIPQHILRNWERELSQLRPRRDASGVRVYRERDLRLVALLRGMIIDDGRSLSEVRAFLDESGARVNGLLEKVDLGAVIGTEGDVSPTPRDTEEQPMGDDLPDDEQLRNPPAEPDAPNTSDEAAQEKHEPPTDRQPAACADGSAHSDGESESADIPVRDDAALQNDDPVAAHEGAAEAAGSPEIEPLPRWVLRELRELRTELVALDQMIESLVGEPPPSEGSADGKDTT